MKTNRIVAAILVVVALCLIARQAQTQTAPVPPAIEVYFSPHGGCTDAVVKELQGAHESVIVQAYSFTSVPIAKALLEAHKRGVNVQVILDRSQRTEKYSSATFLHNSGIPTYIDAAHAIAHNKVMVIDGQIVITGSFNFTKAAEESNAENLLVIRDRDLAAKYTANWEAHHRHSQPYEGRAAAPSAPGANARIADKAAGYAGSKRSDVFHRSSCTSVEKIAEQNLIHYASRDEAIKAAKRPCSICKP